MQRYFQLSDVNTLDSIRPAQLVYNGFEDINASQVNCLKFRIQTQTFPVHVPFIQQSNSIKQMAFNGMTDKSSKSYLNDQYYTSWSLCLLNVTTNEYSSQPVKWIPQKNLELKPVIFPTRMDVLKNPYFYCYNSIHLLSMITATIQQCQTDLGLVEGIRMIKTAEGSFQLLLLTTMGDVKIFFNYDLAQAFNFYYKTDFVFQTNGRETYGYSEVVFETFFVTPLDNKNYYTSQVLSLTTRLFPFSEIQFESSSIGAQQIILGTATNSTGLNTSTPVIFSYSLSVTDIDQPCDNFNYTASSEFRNSYITSNFVNFEMDVYWKTFDGYRLRLSLDRNDSIDMLLQFS